MQSGCLAGGVQIKAWLVINVRNITVAQGEEEGEEREREKS